jgi:hypothetical protein
MLRNIIEDAAETNGKPLKDFTVLSASRDPYRLDTPANHRLGKWLADAYHEVHHSENARRIHLRGLHYKLVGRVMVPAGIFRDDDGKPLGEHLYTNTDKTWLWLSEKAAKAARYLGYLPWEAIKDARNSPPQVFTPDFYPPRWSLVAGEVEIYLPDVLEPRLRISGEMYRQPWRQVVIAEKQGVEDLLLPACRNRDATLALPAGEISDTMVFDLLAAAAEDGRPLAIHQLGDFDPAGRQMAVSTSRTVQAIRDSQFPEMTVRVHAIGLDREHCEEWNLPETPLKETEKRGERWISAMGWQQTELDAAVALAPGKLVSVVDRSLLQYWDHGVADRAAEAKDALESEANARLADQLGDEFLEELRARAEAKLEDLDTLADEINAELAIDPESIDGFDMPEVVEVLIGETDCANEPLFDSDVDWSESTRRLKARKDY